MCDEVVFCIQALGAARYEMSIVPQGKTSNFVFLTVHSCSATM